MFISNVYYLSYLPWSVVVNIHHSDRLLAPQDGWFSLFMSTLGSPSTQPVEQVRYMHRTLPLELEPMTEPDGRAADGGMWGSLLDAASSSVSMKMIDMERCLFTHLCNQLFAKSGGMFAAIVHKILPCKGIANIKKNRAWIWNGRNCFDGRTRC